MSDHTLQTVFQLMAETFDDIPLFVSNAARRGSIDVLRGMLDAGIVKPSDDKCRDVEFFASVLPILTAHGDRAAAEKLVDDVRFALGGFDLEVFGQGFSLLEDYALIRPMVEQGANPNAWMPLSSDRSRAETPLVVFMRNPLRVSSAPAALDILIERDEVPMASYTHYEPGQGPKCQTFFDYLAEDRYGDSYSPEDSVLRLMAMRDERGTLPRSWKVDCGRAVLDMARRSAGHSGLLPNETREDVIIRMLKLAVFDDPQAWLTILSSPVRPGQPTFGHYLASDKSAGVHASAIVAASARDGLHPDLVVSRYGADVPCTWLAAAVNRGNPELTRALLEHGADPNCKPEENSFSAAEEARRDGSNESAQAVNAWVARKVIQGAMQQAVSPAKSPNM